tara:strand:+ start:6505 stop:7014 length:510 start_codon:yes stop_codon:yes gene_type:complete
MKLVQILTDGTMNDIKINENTKTKILSKLGDFIVNKESKIVEYGYWEIDEIKIVCYGSIKGNIKNNHVLMKNIIYKNEDYKNKYIYGDIFILKYNKKKIFDIDVADYALLYNIQEGLSDDEYDSFDEYSEDEYNMEETVIEETENIKVKLPKKDIIIKDIELDIDTNIY